MKTIREFKQMVQMITILATPVFSLKDVVCVALIADESHRTTSKQIRHYPRKNDTAALLYNKSLSALSGTQRW